MAKKDLEVFRLYSRDLNAYAGDPSWHTMRRGVDYPTTIGEKDMCQRLRQAASVRGFGIRTTIGPDFIRFRFFKGRDQWWLYSPR